MNFRKYEKLQIELEKSNDKKLEGEVLQLEKELSIKEDEINAVINLYKEVERFYTIIDNHKLNKFSIKYY